MKKEKQKTTRRGGGRYAIETIQQAIIKARGNQSRAAKMLGLTPGAISMMMKRSPEHRKAIDDAKEIAMVERIKKAEGVVDYHLKKNNLDAAKLVLTKTAFARASGWLDRLDDETSPGRDATNVIFNFPGAIQVGGKK